MHCLWLCSFQSRGCERTRKIGDSTLQTIRFLLQVIQGYRFMAPPRRIALIQFQCFHPFLSRSLVPTYKGYDRYTVWLLHPWLTVLAYLLSTATHPWIYHSSTQVQYLERTGSLVDGHAKVLSWFARCCCWLLPLIYPSSFWCRRLICWYCASVVCSCCCLPLLWFAVDRNSYLWTALKVFNTAHCRNNNNNSNNINTIRKGRRKKEI